MKFIYYYFYKIYNFLRLQFNRLTSKCFIKEVYWLNKYFQRKNNGN